MENGRSISVSRTALPRNSNLEIAHDAATPKTAFNGTLMAAMINVKRMAESVSGSASARQYGPKPAARACAKTLSNGSTRKIAAKSNANEISSQWTQSRPGLRTGAAGAAEMGGSGEFMAP